MRRLIGILAFFICTAPLFNFSVGAAEGYTAEEFGAYEIVEALPDELRDVLPDADLYSADGALNGFDAGYFLGLIRSAAAEALAPALRGLSATLGLMTAVSVMWQMRSLFSSASVSAAFELAGSLAVMLTVYESVSGLVVTVREFLTRLAAVVGASVPVMAAIGVAGGNVTAATVSANGMMLGLAIVEAMASEVLFPVIKLCFGFTVAAGAGGKLKLGGISKAVRDAVSFIFALVGAIISAVMTFQSSIAARADSLTMRAAKFAAAQAVPVVGGIAGDAVGTVATGLSLIRTTVGWVGVALIAVMTLPVVIRLLMMRLGLGLAETAADMLGLEREKGILSEVCGLLGFLTAVSVIAAIMFVYAMALFASAATALS